VHPAQGWWCHLAPLLGSSVPNRRVRPIARGCAEGRSAFRAGAFTCRELLRWYVYLLVPTSVRPNDRAAAVGLPDDARVQIKRENKGKRVPMSTFLAGAEEGGETFMAAQKGRVTEFAVKPWERLAEPTPSIGENDVSISLVLFKTRRF